MTRLYDTFTVCANNKDNHNHSMLLSFLFRFFSQARTLKQLKNQKALIELELTHAVFIALNRIPNVQPKTMSL